MPLRPSGTAAPHPSSLAAFRLYHDELAWTWEPMALTRARAVAGVESLRRRSMDLIVEVLARPRALDGLVTEIAAMRRRIAAQHPEPSRWDSSTGAAVSSTSSSSPNT